MESSLMQMNAAWGSWTSVPHSALADAFQNDRILPKSGREGVSAAILKETWLESSTFQLLWVSTGLIHFRHQASSIKHQASSMEWNGNWNWNGMCELWLYGRSSLLWCATTGLSTEESLMLSWMKVKSRGLSDCYTGLDGIASMQLDLVHFYFSPHATSDYFSGNSVHTWLNSMHVCFCFVVFGNSDKVCLFDCIY